MSFVNECVTDSLPLWQTSLQTPFIQELTNGSLDETKFRDYIIDDSLYLREYSKIFAWGILHAHSMEEISQYYSLLAFVNENENSTRRQYLKYFKLTDQAIQSLPLRPDNQAYVDYMLSVAKTGSGAIECMMASLPCMLSYNYIFNQVIKDPKLNKDSIFYQLISDYANLEYQNDCDKWIKFTDQLCTNLTNAEKHKYMKIFRTSSLYETKFWQMSHTTRNDVQIKNA